LQPPDGAASGYSKETMLTGTWQELTGTLVAGRYTLRTLVDAGEGQAEFLAAVSDEGPSLVSFALIEPDPGGIGQDLEAIGRAKQLQHPNLLHILDGGACLLEGRQMLFIATEAADGSLADALGAGPVVEMRVLLNDLLSALEWLHARGLVYRNLDLRTIVRAGGRWKLADLSRLHPIGEFGRSGDAGPAVPPEAAAGYVLPAWDSWGLGALLRDALGCEAGAMPPPFEAIVTGCLEPDFRRRLSLPQIKALLAPAPPAPAPREEAAPHRRRAWIALAAAAAILGGLFFVLRSHSGSPPPAAPTVSRKASRAESAPPRPAPPPARSATAAAAYETGRASYVSNDLEGIPTASGEPFNNQAMTAAHREFPLGTRLRVTNLKNGRSVVVRVNDRGPYRRGYILSVTRRAAERLGFVKTGSARVRLEPLP
jgi:rare lipoprotein A